MTFFLFPIVRGDRLTGKQPGYLRSTKENERDFFIKTVNTVMMDDVGKLTWFGSYYLYGSYERVNVTNHSS